MIAFLAKIFIKNNENYGDARVRGGYGVLIGAFFIVLNAVLFAGKLAAGLISRSVSITADAFNNLSDAGSSIITLLGFKLASQKPDTEHPFGHGRFEYIAGLLVSTAIILMGFELLKTSIERIITPEETELSLLSGAILGVSVAVKLYMAFSSGSYAKRLRSPALKATMRDSLSDSAATALVLIAAIVSKITGARLDGWVGALVSVFVLYSGVMSGKETIAPLLGQMPEPEFVDRVKELVLSTERITGLHDLIIHDYGSGRRMISLHAEVPVEKGDDFFKIHDIIDETERRIAAELGCEATIHLDPVALGDERTEKLKARTLEALHAIDSALTLHDFRIVPSETRTTLIFDVVIPYDCRLSEGEVVSAICEAVSRFEGESGVCFRAVVTADRPFA